MLSKLTFLVIYRLTLNNSDLRQTNTVLKKTYTKQYWIQRRYSPVKDSIFSRHFFVKAPEGGCFWLLQRHCFFSLFILKSHLNTANPVLSVTHIFLIFFNLCWLFVASATFAWSLFIFWSFLMIKYDPNELCFHYLEWSTLRSL